MMKRLLPMAALAAALFATAPAAEAAVITLAARTGGYTHHHMDAARRWLKAGHAIVITGDQQSAAAIQVIWLARRGLRVCARDGVMLYLHEGRSRGGAITNANRRLLGRSYGAGWYRPQRFGIGGCR